MSSQQNYPLKTEFNKFPNSANNNSNNNNFSKVTTENAQPQNKRTDQNVTSPRKAQERYRSSPDKYAKSGFSRYRKYGAASNVYRPTYQAIRHNYRIQEHIDSPAASPDATTERENVKTPRSDGQTTRRLPLQKAAARDVPGSIEAEYRKILGITKQCLADLRDFKNRSTMSNDIDYTKCKESAIEVVRAINLEESEIERAEEMSKLLAQRKLGSGIQKRSETQQLELLCEKATRFEELVPDVRQKLHSCIDRHLAKYCLSFAEELKNHDNVSVKCVMEYEQSINERTNAVNERMNDINKCYENYKNGSTPFITNFFSSTSELLETMDTLVDAALQVCYTINKWCYADKTYPLRLWDVIKSVNRVRIGRQDAIKKIREKKEQILPILQRKEFARDRVFDLFNEVKTEQRKLVTHKENLSKRIEQTENEIQDKQEQLDAVNYEYDNRKYNNPKYVEAIWKKKETFELERFKLEERLHQLQRQRERYEKLDVELDEKRSDYEYELMAKQDDVDVERKKIKFFDNDISNRLKQLKKHDHQIAAAKSIREMKLAPSTLRKIYFHRLDASSHDILQDVCKVVSENIGHGWEDLYLDLPFSPPRSTDKRAIDLEKIKHNIVQRDIPGSKLAWQCLQKWRIFNKNGNVQQMVKSLQRLKKYALAHKVEHMHQKAHTLHP